MDFFSFLIFFIYALVILMILIYISPLLSALVMIILPVASVFFLPDMTQDFLSKTQFSFVVPIHNIHILLLIWSAFIGIIAYAEVLSWYLLREIKPKKQEKPAAVPEPSGEAPKPGKKFKDFLNKFIKIMRGEK